VDKRGTYTFKEYINEHKNTINSLKQALSIWLKQYGMPL
jgi:hypothetical protein